MLMDCFLRLLCSLLIGLVVASGAALLPAQVYWHTVLPNTPMPAALSDLLSSGNTGARNEKRGSFIVPETNNNGWNRAWGGSSTAEHFHDIQVNGYFLEQDLHPGYKITLQFDKTNDVAKFLPRSVAESIPFSSKKLTEVISRFSVQPGSNEEKAMKKTLSNCEEPEVKGEKKLCATSLESIADFAVASLGTRNVIAASTTVHLKNEAPRQEYTIAPSGVKNLARDQLVACHQISYAYAVFYCHLTESSTKGYTVKMTGKDGTVVDAVAVCHTDTSAWNPKHLAFQVLNVKPGTAPVCHFFPRENHVIFSSST